MKALRVFLLSAVLLMASASLFATKPQDQDAVPLPEGAGISCLQHTVDYSINLGVFSFTYHVLWTICDNGEEYADVV